MDIRDKDNIPADNSYCTRLSAAAILLFKKTIRELIIATHKLTREQSITLEEYAAMLSEQGIPDEWTGWIKDVIGEIQDKQDTQ